MFFTQTARSIREITLHNILFSDEWEAFLTALLEYRRQLQRWASPAREREDRRMRFMSRTEARGAWMPALIMVL